MHCVARARGRLIVEALERLRATLPFPLRGIDTDNGSEFINEVLIAFCADHGIEFTRSRPYRKMIRPGSSRRTGRWFAGSSATALEGIAAGDVPSPFDVVVMNGEVIGPRAPHRTELRTPPQSALWCHRLSGQMVKRRRRARSCDT